MPHQNAIKVNLALREWKWMLLKQVQNVFSLLSLRDEHQTLYSFIAVVHCSVIDEASSLWSLARFFLQLRKSFQLKIIQINVNVTQTRIDAITTFYQTRSARSSLRRLLRDQRKTEKKSRFWNVQVSLRCYNPHIESKFWHKVESSKSANVYLITHKRKRCLNESWRTSLQEYLKSYMDGKLLRKIFEVSSGHES